MTTNEHPDKKQLLELAVLDGFGLLEPLESELFNAAFLDAPVAVQEEVTRIQEDLATDETLLPDELPDSALRKRVLDAVAKAADDEAKRLAPLALIGARAGRRTNHTSRGSSAWRAVAMVLFGVSVVLAAFAINANDRANNITKYALNADVEQTLTDLIGSEFGEFIRNPSAPAVGLERENGDPTGYIRVAINERTGAGYILAIDLKDGEEFIIQGTTPDGEVLELARIHAGNTPVIAQTFSVDKAIAGQLTYRAVTTSGEVAWT
ncbi:MAG: hypothetical protein QGI78_07985 [Phycisphaerales bacterium]|jgi:hypothetical protein|nr:hypothetical protein [Phycisphaerales bacterium]